MAVYGSVVSGTQSPWDGDSDGTRGLETEQSHPVVAPTKCLVRPVRSQVLEALDYGVPQEEDFRYQLDFGGVGSHEFSR